MLALILVNIDQTDMLVAIWTGDSHAERVEWATAISPMFRVKGDEALKRGNLLRKLMAESQQIFVYPLRRCLLDHHCGDGLNPAKCRYPRRFGQGGGRTP